MVRGGGGIPDAGGLRGPARGGRGRRRAGRGQRPDRWWVHRRAAGTDVVVDGRPSGRPDGAARPEGHRGVARDPAGRRPHLGVHDRDQRSSGHRGGSQGVDTRWGVSRVGVPDRRVPRRLRDARLALALPRGRAPGGPRPRPGGDPHRGGAVAPQPDDRHRRLAAGLLRAQARHRIRLADGRALHRLLAVGAWNGGVGRSRHDVAGVQRVGRLQPVLRPRGRPAQLGRQLRPAVQPGDRRERLPHGRPPGGAAGRAARDPAELLRERRPRPGLQRPRRRPWVRLDGSRRVLDAGDARGGRASPRRRHEPGLPRREHDVLADPPGRPAADRVPVGRRPGPAARHPARGGHVAVPRRAGARAGADRDRDDVRVLPGRRRLRRRVPDVVGL